MSARDAIRYVLLPGRYPTALAKARALWVYLVLRHDSETCFQCGRRVERAIGTYWRTSNRLWESVVGDEGGILCVRCFVRRAGAVHVEVVDGV